MSQKELKLLNILTLVDLKNISEDEINYFKNKKILITGVSGVIGINLLFFFNALTDQKKIRIDVEGTYKTSLFTFIKNFFKKKKLIKFTKIDLTKKNIDFKKKYDLIFHCAGYGQPSKFTKYSKSIYKLNSSTIMDLEKNLKKNGKFIYMSTTEIYSGNINVCNENDIGNTTTHHPRSSYIESKKFGESYLINSIKNFIIYRVCLIFGPGAKLNDERILNLLLLRSIKKNQIDIYGGLNQVRSNLFISDAINMIIKSTVKFNNQVFNISNHKMTTLGEMVKIISKLSNKKIKNYKGFLKGSPNIIRISNKKILNAIDYKILVGLKEGLLKTYSWYKYLIT